MRLRLTAVVLALVVAACSPADEETGSTIAEASSTTSTTATVTTTAPAAPPDGPMAVVGVLEIPHTLNPIAEGGTRAASALVQQATLPGAFVHDPETWRVVPFLVERIPTVEAGDISVFGDRQEVTWTVGPDAVWSDGVPVSGADFAFTLRAGFGQTECGGREDFDSLFGFEIVEVSDKAITISMPGPTTRFEGMFRAVLPSHATDGATVCTDDGVGWPSAGPFVAASLEEDRVGLVRNDAYWGATPALTAVEFVRFDDEASLVAAMAAGDVDVAVVSSDEAAAAAEDSGVAVIAQPSGRIEHLAFDFRAGSGEEELLSTLEFRQGIARAIDVESMAATTGWLRVDGVARGVTPPEPWEVYGYDAEEAMRLIGVACEQIGRDCGADPPELRLLATGFGVRPAVVERVAADLRAVGVTVTVDVVSSLDLTDRIAGGEWDVAVLSMSEPAGVGAMARWLLDALDPESLGNVYGYGGTGSIAATERSAFQLRLFSGQVGVAPDLVRAARLLGEAHELVAREVVFVPLVARPRFTLVGDGLEGVVPNISPSGLTWNIGDWSRPTG